MAVVDPARPPDVDSLSRLLSYTRPFKVICVDDRQAAGDRGHLARLGRRRNCEFIRHEIPSGPAAARNTALVLADTPYVYFAHDGEIPEPAFVETLLSLAHIQNAPAVVPRSLLGTSAGAAVVSLQSGPVDLRPFVGNEDLLAGFFTLPASGILWSRDLISRSGFPVLSFDWFADMPFVSRAICSLDSIYIADVASAPPARTLRDFDLDQRENLLVALFKAFGLATDQLKEDRRSPVQFEALARCVEGLLLELCNRTNESDIMDMHKINFLQNALMLKAANFQYRDALRSMDETDLVNLLGSAQRFAPRQGLVW